MTKYYEKKGDGVFFAACPKDDRDMSVEDGRVERHWNYGGKDGSTVGFEVSELAGLIESAYLQEFDNRSVFNIGLQTNKGIAVLQVQLMGKDAQGLAKKLRGIDLSKDVCFGAWLNSKGTFKAHGREITPCYLTTQQFDEETQKGKAVEGTFPYVQDKGYEGLPAGIKTTKMGKDTWNFDARDEVLYKEITDFIARFNKEIGDSRKNARPQTPAEAQKQTVPPEDDDEEVPF